MLLLAEVRVVVDVSWTEAKGFGFGVDALSWTEANGLLGEVATAGGPTAGEVHFLTKGTE